MVKYVVIFNPRPGLDPKELEKYWLEIHVPNVKKTPGLRKYVINKAMAVEGEKPAFFGMAELWFDDVQSAQEGLRIRRERYPDEFSSMIDDGRVYMEETEIEL